MCYTRDREKIAHMPRTIEQSALAQLLAKLLMHTSLFCTVIYGMMLPQTLNFSAKKVLMNLLLWLTESINFSIASNSKPAYVIYLDAKNAFDLVLREILITDLYEIGIKDQGLVLIDEKLKNRKTVCEWDRILMGPIRDDCGVEQGGINSSEYYKV